MSSSNSLQAPLLYPLKENGWKGKSPFKGDLEGRLFFWRLGLQYPTHANAINSTLIEVLDHMHGGDDGEVAAGGDLLKGVDDVLAYSFDVATGSLLVVGRDEGEEIAH